MNNERRSIPIFKLYGESGQWHTPDLVHSESIALRSRQHNWQIKPHRHSDLVQLLYLQQGDATAQLDGVAQPLKPPCVVLTSKMCVHGFSFSREVKGYVLSLAAPLVEKMSDHLGTHHTVLMNTRCYDVRDEHALIDTLFATVDREYNSPHVGRELLLESIVSTLVILLSRSTYDTSQQATGVQDKSSQHYSRYLHMVEHDYKTHRSIEDYADELGISSAHLNALCQRFAGHCALHVAHQRLMLEAKRHLIYTSMTISEISDTLGFSEPAYFTRFFKRFTGVSPKVYRSNSGTD